MLCPNCRKENEDDSLFCSQCGTKLKGDIQTETKIIRVNSELVNSENQMGTGTKIKKVFNKKYIWGIIISVLVISICIFSFKQYNDNKSFNLNVTEAEKNYKADKFSEAKKYYQAALNYKKDAGVKSKIKLCDNMQSSYSEYKKGIEALNKKDYLTAYNSFKKVIPEDVKRLSIAKDKLAESSKLYIESELGQAKEFAIKTDYQMAIIHIESILNIDPNNENAKTLKNQYQAEAQKKLDEQKRVEAEQEKQKKIDEARSIIKINSVYTSEPNSAGGVDLHVIWTNTSSKIIKYAVFEVVPYNAVGDPQQCTIRHDSSSKGKVTGPINPGETYGENKVWECAWYNNTITNAKTINVDITYMDGSTASLDKDQIQYVY